MALIEPFVSDLRSILWPQRFRTRDAGVITMKRPWLVFSAICLCVAAVTLLIQHIDIAFVAGAAGAVSWFLDLRSEMQKRVLENAPRDSETEDKSEDTE